MVVCLALLDTPFDFSKVQQRVSMRDHDGKEGMGWGELSRKMEFE
jgi:hypothetical protein